MTRENQVLRRRASHVLNTRGGRLSLVLAALCALLVSTIVFYITELVLPTVLTELAGVISMPFGGALPLPELLFFLFFLVFAMPLWLGMYRMAVLMVRGGEPLWHEVFHFASDARLWMRSIAIGFSALLPWLPCALFLTLGLYASSYELEGLFGALCILSLPLGLLLMNGSSGVTALMVGDDSMSRRAARGMAARILCGKRMRLLGRSFLSSVICFLSVVCTVGVLFLLHTLPMALLTGACRMNCEETL